MWGPTAPAARRRRRSSPRTPAAAPAGAAGSGGDAPPAPAGRGPAGTCRSRQLPPRDECVRTAPRVDGGTLRPHERPTGPGGSRGRTRGGRPEVLLDAGVGDPLGDLALKEEEDREQ